jgi:hypothetical protein
VLQQKGILVYRDEYENPEQMTDVQAVPQSIMEFFPSHGGTHYFGMAAARLLTSDGTTLVAKNPVGVPVGPDTNGAGMFDWLSRLGVSGGETQTLSGPVAIEVSPGGMDDPLRKIRMQLPKRPAADRPLIGQIMLNMDRK